MNQLQPKIRESLVAIGHAKLRGGACSEDDVAAFRSLGAINRQRPEFWDQAAAGLSDNELAELACGLAFVETEFRWLGGSASGVIWLFLALVARNASIDLLDQVAGWVLANSYNPYNPFGTTVSLGARVIPPFSTPAVSGIMRPWPVYGPV